MEEFTVMTANVAGQDRFGWQTRKDISAQVFKDAPCDLVGFQEFGLNCWDIFGRVRPDLTLIAGMPAGDININSVAFRAERFELLEEGNFWLSEDGTYRKAWDGSERGATWVKLRDKLTGKKLMLLNIHLDNISTEAQTKGVEMVLRFVSSQDSSLPVIITADSNVSVGSNDIRWQNPDMRRPYNMMKEAGFLDTWVETHLENPERPFTYHGFMGDGYQGDQWGTYDTEWIMARGFKPIACELVKGEIDGKFASDHYWMKATLAFY